MDLTDPPGKTLPPKPAAFAVHVFTACGAACALLALLAAVRADWTSMFVWLGVALIIDGVDGTFARKLRVAELLPRWSGDVLDLVVDILNYVFVPPYAIASSGFVPRLVGGAQSASSAGARTDGRPADGIDAGLLASTMTMKIVPIER